MCTADWICSRTASAGSLKPDIATMFSSRVSASRGVLAWMVPIEPSWPVFIACSMSMASSDADLADDDPVGAHAQRVLDQVADGDLALALDVGGAGLEPHDVRLLQLQLGGVLDRHGALAVVDHPRHGVEERGLARAGAAGDQDVEPRAPGDLQHGRHVGGDVALPRHHVEGDLLLGELADRDGRAVDGERRDDDVDAGAVLEAGVDQRRRLVDPAADLGDDAGRDVQHVRVVAEDDVGQLEPCPCARRRPGAGR